MIRFVPIALFVLLTGCAASDQQLRARVASDLTCNEDVQINQIDENTRSVSACSKKVTYMRTCKNDAQGEEQCAWSQYGPATITTHYSFTVAANDLGLQPVDSEASEPAKSESASSSASSDDDDDDSE